MIFDDNMKLKFNNGKFRIMQIADTQDTSMTSADTVNFIKYALLKQSPIWLYSAETS